MDGRDGCVCVYRWESWMVVMVVSVCVQVGIVDGRDGCVCVYRWESWMVVMVVSVCTGGNRGWS